MEDSQTVVSDQATATYDEQIATEQMETNTNTISTGGTETDPQTDNPNQYDPNSVNGNDAEVANYETGGVTENGAMQNETLGQPYEEVVYSVEEERLWNLVRENCLDFNSWTALIDETERVAVTDITKIRKVYDAFLAEFPLCFGYWKKYADHEARLDSVEKVVEVYERAVLAVTYSVEIWVNYCQFAISTYEDPEIIRRLFERGLAYVGTDYRSDILWDEYIRYEESQQAWSNVAMIYTKILEQPIQQFDRYFNCLKELVSTRPLSDVLTADEAATVITTTEADQSDKPVTADSANTEELEKYIAVREEMYKKAKDYDSKIVGFETAIRRPYFHVRPLDDPELENWHSYLDFTEKEEDFNKVVKLYERCLIACANYPEFWIRYVLYMHVTGSLELANNALARATQVFVKKQPEIHLFAARFKELTGDVSAAREEYQLIYSEISPGLLESIVKHANMEYRLGDKEAAFSVYEKAISAEQEKENSQLLPVLLVQYSRFLYLVAGNVEKAREVLDKSLEEMQLSKPVIEAVIHLESITPSLKRVDFLNSLVEKFITPDPENPNTVASPSEREELSCIFLEFLDMFGDTEQIKKATNMHTKLFSRQRSTLPSRKRRADNSLSSDSSKLMKTEDPNQPLMGGAYNPNANAAAQTQPWPSAAAPYAQKNPTWPQTYPSQAGYSAYGGYAGYGAAAAQMPQPAAPQATAYAATYPATYPTQAYAQPSVAQPAIAQPPISQPVANTAIATQPAAPAAAATQPYYGTYY